MGRVTPMREWVLYGVYFTMQQVPTRNTRAGTGTRDQYGTDGVVLCCVVACVCCDGSCGLWTMAGGQGSLGSAEATPLAWGNGRIV